MIPIKVKWITSLVGATFTNLDLRALPRLPEASQYQETLEAFSNGTGQVDAQMAHLEQLFRRDRIIGQARRELRGK